MLKENKKMLFVDIETTGLNEEIDKIIKFSYVLVNNKTEVVDSKSLCIKQGLTLLRGRVLSYLGIDKQEIKEGCKVSEFCDILKSLLDNNILIVSYNVSFLKKFLERFLAKHKMEQCVEKIEYLDLLTVVRTENPTIKNCRLQKILSLFEIPEEECVPNLYLQLFNVCNQKYDLSYYVEK